MRPGWPFVSVVFISFFTATITTALTVKQLEQGISGPQDLVGKKVAVTAGSTGAAYLRQQNIDALEVQQITQAYEALLDGRPEGGPVLLPLQTGLVGRLRRRELRVREHGRVAGLSRLL